MNTKVTRHNSNVGKLQDKRALATPNKPIPYLDLCNAVRAVLLKCPVNEEGTVTIQDLLNAGQYESKQNVSLEAELAYSRARDYASTVLEFYVGIITASTNPAIDCSKADLDINNFLYAADRLIPAAQGITDKIDVKQVSGQAYLNTRVLQHKLVEKICQAVSAFGLQVNAAGQSQKRQ